MMSWELKSTLGHGMINPLMKFFIVCNESPISSFVVSLAILSLDGPANLLGSEWAFATHKLNPNGIGYPQLEIKRMPHTPFHIDYANHPSVTIITKS
jgi:hypothetical protein